MKIPPAMRCECGRFNWFALCWMTSATLLGFAADLGSGKLLGWLGLASIGMALVAAALRRWIAGCGEVDQHIDSLKSCRSITIDGVRFNKEE